MPKLAIQELEKQYGDLHQVIPPLVNTHGQTKTAQKLKISPATINAWLKANHYRKHITYVQEPA